jgi:hypothetical protein
MMGCGWMLAVAFSVNVLGVYVFTISRQGFGIYLVSVTVGIWDSFSKRKVGQSVKLTTDRIL